MHCCFSHLLCTSEERFDFQTRLRLLVVYTVRDEIRFNIKCECVQKYNNKFTPIFNRQTHNEFKKHGYNISQRTNNSFLCVLNFTEGSCTINSMWVFAVLGPSTIISFLFLYINTTGFGVESSTLGNIVFSISLRHCRL